MKELRKSIPFFFITLAILFSPNIYCQQFSAQEYNCFDFNSDSLKLSIADTPVAINDTFILVANCYNKVLTGNVLKNDVITKDQSYKVCFVYAPNKGTLTFGSNGNFTFSLNDGFRGELMFDYILCETTGKYGELKANALIRVVNDYDCDNIPDLNDLDDDNDGILDIDEGDGLIDSDMDGIPDSRDIDSDNDGITDNVEWQSEMDYIEPTVTDANKNGWDDAYDITLTGVYYVAVDTDGNGIPDFLDTDSDSDGLDDNTEGFDTVGDGLPDIFPLKSDTDLDGLDDAYDLISCWSIRCNSTGSKSPLPDLNNNGIRDWREKSGQIPEEPTFTLEFHPELFVFPNPSDGRFKAVVPVSSSEEKFKLTIYNIQGAKVYQKLVNPGENEMLIENIKPGTYIVLLQSNLTNYRQSILIY